MVVKNFGRVATSLAVLVLLLFTNSLASAQQKISGRIVDLTENGIADIVVSDGFNIIKSDPKGNFFFETNPRARFIFISTPSGYEQENNFFCRLDKDLPASLIFKLRKVSNQPNTFIHIGDTEATIYKNWVDGLKDYIANHKLAFLLLNGDICYEKGMNFHAREITKETMGLRVVYSVGNHDLVAGDYGEQLYEKLFGPVWYSFNVGDVHFVNLPVSYGDKVPSYNTDEIYNWLRKDLDALPKATPVVLITHHLYGYSDDFVMKTDKQSLDLNAWNFKGYLYAHYHTNTFHRTEKGVSLFSTMSPNKGGIDHSPSSFRVLTFNKKGDLSSEIKYSNLDNHIVANGFLENNSNSYTVIANIYDTGSEVERADVVVGSKVYPMVQKSSWSWLAKMPKGVGDKAAGGEDLKIKVKFSDGSIVFRQVITGHNPEIKWVTNLGGNTFMTSPLLAGSLVISSTSDDDTTKNAAIHAVDRLTGEKKWSFKTKNSVRNNMALWEGTVLVCDIEGTLYALDAFTGELKWSKGLREKAIQPIFAQGVTVDKGIVFAGFGNNLSAVRISDGKVLWVNTAWKGGGVSTVASPVVDTESGVLLTAGYWLGRFAHEVSTGKLIWEKRDEDSRICDNPPVVFQGKFFYTSPDYITEVDPLTGVELVKQKINYTANSNSRPVVTDKYFIVGTADKGIVAFDRQNNYKELWNFKTNPALFYTVPYTKDFQMTVESGACLDGENLYFGANDGFLYCVDVRNGLFRWRMNLGAPILGNIVVDSGILYVSDFGGNLWSVKI